MIKTRLVQVVESRFVPNKYGEFHIIPDPNFVQSLAANPARRIGIDRHRSDLVESLPLSVLLKILGNQWDNHNALRVECERSKPNIIMTLFSTVF
jgi:hypothetical protein